MMITDNSDKLFGYDSTVFISLKFLFKFIFITDLAT